MNIKEQIKKRVQETGNNVSVVEFTKQYKMYSTEYRKATGETLPVDHLEVLSDGTARVKMPKRKVGNAKRKVARKIPGQRTAFSAERKKEIAARRATREEAVAKALARGVVLPPLKAVKKKKKSFIEEMIS
jgi:hypothetical protein